VVPLTREILSDSYNFFHPLSIFDRIFDISFLEFSNPSNNHIPFHSATLLSPYKPLIHLQNDQHHQKLNHTLILATDIFIIHPDLNPPVPITLMTFLPPSSHTTIYTSTLSENYVSSPVKTKHHGLPPPLNIFTAPTPTLMVPTSTPPFTAPTQALMVLPLTSTLTALIQIFTAAIAIWWQAVAYLHQHILTAPDWWRLGLETLRGSKVSYPLPGSKPRCASVTWKNSKEPTSSQGSLLFSPFYMERGLTTYCSAGTVLSARRT